MCCFSGAVESVSSTKIFARSAPDGRQYLAYEMFFSAREDLAMILPLPVPPGSADDAVRFISLKEYRTLFRDLAAGFPRPAKGEDGPPRPSARADAPPLPVVEVGDFEASFVPSVKDFARLDARFRLPEATWDKLPGYRDFGFAVFKLKKGARNAHPMAFQFPRRQPARLFFPTVHVHDGTVKEKAGFDHALYCQSGEGEALRITDWTESPGLASGFVDVAKAQGLVAPDRHAYLLEIRGERKNEDVVV
jgi:hypothetical protein